MGGWVRELVEEETLDYAAAEEEDVGEEERDGGFWDGGLGRGDEALFKGGE